MRMTRTRKNQATFPCTLANMHPNGAIILPGNELRGEQESAYSSPDFGVQAWTQGA